MNTRAASSKLTYFRNLCNFRFVVNVPICEVFDER